MNPLSFFFPPEAGARRAFPGLWASLALFAATAPGAAQTPAPPCPASRRVVWTDCEGSYTYDDWSKYVGAFKDDKRHGQGTMTYPDGQSYHGGFVNDRREGAGVYTAANGVRWTGKFRNDKPNGRGVLTDRAGKPLKEGLWADGVFIGDGGAAPR